MSVQCYGIGMLGRQVSLFGGGDPRIDRELRAARRLALAASPDESPVDRAWVDHVRGWVEGYDTLFGALERGMTWRASERKMYDRVVAVPRLLARAPADGAGHPLLAEMRDAISSRYGVRVGPPSLALYRGGSDSVAWHRDRPHKDLPEALVAIVSLGGGLRKFMLRPFGGGESHTLNVGLGDLVVMGGSCQRTWEHCIPKTRRAEPRIAIIFRHPSPYGEE